jgi:hypothetical protein
VGIDFPILLTVPGLEYRGLRAGPNQAEPPEVKVRALPPRGKGRLAEMNIAHAEPGCDSLWSGSAAGRIDRAAKVA